MAFSYQPRSGLDLHWPRPGCRGGRSFHASPSPRFRPLLAAALCAAALIHGSAGPLHAQPLESGDSTARAAPHSGLVASGAAPALVESHPVAAGRGPAPAPPPATPAGAPAPPHDLGDLNGWLDYKARSHVTALPLEARLFYRRGVLAHESGMTDEGERWVRAAAELDPSFVAPHVTLAAWSLLSEPSQALLQYATVMDLARQNFLLQLTVAANTLFLGFQSLLVALLLAGMMIVALHVPELCHPWREKLARILRAETARWWALAFVVLPYLAGLGPVLPTLVFLGFLWPVLRGRERAAFLMLLVTVAAIPWAAAMLDRFARPLDPDRAPLYGVSLLEGEPWSNERQQRLAALAVEQPDNPFLHFGLAWMARRGGDLATAEQAYRGALERWAGDDRVLNNLGNTLAMEGRQNEALEFYQRAISSNPSNAAAYFNSSQIYTQRFEFRAATEALSRASALNFDLVRTYQSQGTDDGMLPLVDQWIAPRSFWLALSQHPGHGTAVKSLPPSWRTRIEATGWFFSLAAVAAALLGLGFGLLEYRATPLRTCSNCGHVVCRRCAERRREVALCPSCAVLESRAENPDFARVLLRQHQRQRLQVRHLVRTAVATIIPGFGLLAFRRLFTPILLLTLSVLLVSQWAVASLPFEFEPRLAISDQLLPLPLVLGLSGLVYLWSLTGYFARVAKARAQAAALAAPVRTRAVQATRHVPAAA